MNQPGIDFTEPGIHAGQDKPTPACNCGDCHRTRQSPAHKARMKQLRQQLLDQQRKAQP